jgi:hypothetical protein
MRTEGAVDVRIGSEIPYSAKVLLDDLRLLQAQIDGLPGPRLHQDHDFDGEPEALATLYGWLRETAWVPYWGGGLLLLGGRDPWIETLEMRLWQTLSALAEKADCRLVGRGAVAPDDDELALIHIVYPELAASQGWVFAGQGDVVQ